MQNLTTSTTGRRLSEHDQEIVDRMGWDLDELEARATELTGYPAQVTGLWPLMFDAMIRVAAGPFTIDYDGPNAIYSIDGTCGRCGSDTMYIRSGKTPEQLRELAAHHAQIRRPGALGVITRLARRAWGCCRQPSYSL
ncbi:hypothetical protein [Paenarthrobacter sp. C1]|uniref:hypothetical protein n=1 Tax=Paenarthrobacter sp. C1 TaxID=3400220 RepID=UPI003BF55B09